ncbi:pyridoxal-phosphate dependent enzyme [Luteimonas sp. Y-2-2-4F]|nr:pyridoxal-phosphate dependent enzyme [Luteimonas sp. Y-2-2-4F]MCD9032463.1 pyridoxal-phosphate dependent enzyme [Luteimonas sp. Y-2-2-4F]
MHHAASASPTLDDVLDAAARIAPHAHATPVLRSRAIDAMAGCTLHFKAEHLQRTGAFKFRGACSTVWSLSDAEAARGVVTHSSGNHGAALALAAAGRGIACHVVTPTDAVPAKLAAIAGYGAALHRSEPTLAAREAACTALQRRSGATLVHPYRDPRVMAGQGTAALELIGAAGPLDAVVVPVGGGGLAAGTAIALGGLAPGTRLVLAEPAGADDAARSLRTGVRVEAQTPDTVCDGLRTLLGAPNFEILQRAGAETIVVDDAATLAAMRLIWQRMKQLVEPSSAVALAAVLAAPERFAGLRVGVILSGGNADVPALVRGGHWP